MRIQLRRPVSKATKVSFFGDTVPGYPIYEPISTGQRLLEHLGNCDIVIANLESPLTTASHPKQVGTSLRSDPASVSELKELNVSIWGRLYPVNGYDRFKSEDISWVARWVSHMRKT